MNTFRKVNFHIYFISEVIGGVTFLFLLCFLFAHPLMESILFILIQLGCFLFCLFGFDFLQSHIKVSLPNSFALFFYLFVAFHFLFGEILHFYYLFPFYDSFLHYFSGICLFFLNKFILEQTHNSFKSTFFTFFYSCCFAISLEVLWEILEFSLDSIFFTNMQRYINLYSNEIYQGQDALKDTMKDLILTVLGSLTSTLLLLCFSFKKIEKYK